MALIVAFVTMVIPAASFASSPLCSEANINAYFRQTEPRASTINKAAFYQAIKPVFREYEHRGQHFRGTDAILDRWNSDPRLKDTRWLAYILATSFHETARRMFPVREHLAESDSQALRIFRNSKAYRHTTYWRQNPQTGEHYFGRGYVQLTWDYNYKRADLRFNNKSKRDSFYWNPDNALEPDRAIDVTYDGMIYGWFTGHCLLAHFQPNRRADWYNARRIINGIDRANLIAGYAVEFLAAIDTAKQNSTRKPQKTPISSPSLAKPKPITGATIAAMEVRNAVKRTDTVQSTSDEPDPNPDEVHEPQLQSEESNTPLVSDGDLATAFEKLQNFFIWISPALSCLIWLLAKLASLLAMALEWISNGLIWISEWLAQFSASADEQTTS